MTGAIHPHELADPDVLGGHEEQVLLRGLPWSRFLVLGDSVAEGVGDSVDGYGDLTWGERVARALRRRRPELVYRNLGERGLRTHEVRERQLAQALEFAPDLAAVCAGGNDAMAESFDPAALERELEALVAPLREAGADVFLFTLFDIAQAIEMPAPWGPRLRERLAELSRVTVAVAQRNEALVVDCANHPRCADASIYSADMLHLNRRGHAIAASATVRVLARAVATPAEAAFELA